MAVNGMCGIATTETPSVALSFANNFWGKDDAGVSPLLERMHAAKTTCDELKSFYNARASIEDDYARKLMSLCRKSLGSQEMGTLKHSLDTVRGEVESIAKQHQNIATQMKTELEEPLAAFAGGMKERRKIVQNTVEKLLKIKIQQTQLVNKTRDRYEQDCLKIKGYLAQGHMVMGQEERKNKARLEKTQISLATSNTEYEAAVKALEETTARWNREWKAAADKFQDLEEERLDFTKNSLWTFANIASTVCVSDDASCEKIRLSLEKMEVEKDIMHFIKERGTGQEIPDPPKYINFCRGDVDSQSEVSEDENYSVAQFPRSINPQFRSSSPQPSTYESHHDPNSALARDLNHMDLGPGVPASREVTITPQKALVPPIPQPETQRPRQHPPSGYQPPRANNLEYDPNEFAPVPHDPYPLDGMTMLCRKTTRPTSNTHDPLRPTGSDLSNNFRPTGSDLSASSYRPTGSDLSASYRQTGSELSAATSSGRPSSRGSNSDYSNPTSFSSQEPGHSNAVSPLKQDPPSQAVSPDKKVLKKKSGFFSNNSPFGRKKSMREVAPSNSNTWGPSSGNQSSRPTYGRDGSSQSTLLQDRTASPEPIDANASLALNVGNNIFPVQTPDRRSQQKAADPSLPDDDPIALALAELKGVTSGAASGKQSASRMSADHYHGIATPAPGSAAGGRDRDRDRDQQQPLFSRSVPVPGSANRGKAGTPPPGYDQQAAPVQRLGVPPPAVTSKAMKEASRQFQEQTRTMFNAPGANRPGSGAYNASASVHTPPSTRRQHEMPRAASPAPPRSASPRPGSRADYQTGYNRSASPNPYSGSQRGSTSATPKQQQQPPQARGSDQGYYQRHASPGDMPRAASPSPYGAGGRGDEGSEYGGSMRGRGGGNGARPGTSQSNRGGQMSFYEPPGAVGRARSKSVADGRQFTRDGRPIMHYARALYMYQAAIPEELGFSKGDTLAVLRHQDDGWWEATVQGGSGQVGLVPSNYLQAM
ncbi:hypothetical protein GE09DRAFT_1225066 [Coniochaeta sp. 2T2.1]|nr:hypothetical protein GE09DRAFT_1225066 [Coniochaeta sp. 2T2.1]